jgi:hypothetical protein
VGFAARMELVDDFLKRKELDAILLVDMDMVLPKDGLEKLREHDLDMVSGHYFRRDTNPLMSVCMHLTEEWGDWPVPMVDIPDKLTKIYSSGFGFVLIKREVVEKVAKIPHVGHPMSVGQIPEQGHTELFGQDIRFFHYAKKLGYDLWLDPNVECKHATTVYTSKYLYDILRPHQTEEWERVWEDFRCRQKNITKSASKNWRRFAA